MVKSYDRIAGIYNRLSRIVFGNLLFEAQGLQLEELIHCKKLLVAGGGTGKMLEVLDHLQFRGAIDFVDSSSKMIESARDRKGILNVRFAVSDINHWGIRGYDGCHMAFFLDQFSDRELERMLEKVSEFMDPGGTVIVTDFVSSGSFLYRGLLRLMYFFFRNMTGITASQLPDWEMACRNKGWKEVKRESLYRQRIQSVVYRV